MTVDIKNALKENGVSIEELARRLGINRQTVYYYIKQGDKNPLVQLERIAEAIDIPVTDFFEKPSPGGLTCPKCGTELCIDVREK